MSSSGSTSTTRSPRRAQLAAGADLDPAAAEVGEPLERRPEQALERVDDAAVGDGDHLAVGRQVVDPAERRDDPLEQHLVGLPARRPAPLGLGWAAASAAGPLPEAGVAVGGRRVEVAGPVALDLGAGEARPLAGVALAQARLEHHRPHAERLGDDQRGLAGPLRGRTPRWRRPRRGCGPACSGLVAAEVGERRVGLALPAAVGVPLRLPVADEQHAGHGERTYPDRPARPHRSGWVGPEGPVATLARAAEDPEEVAAWPCCDCSPGPARPPAPGATSCPGATVAAVLDAARARYGAAFADLLEHCAIWRNGEPCELDDAVGDADEVAVLPPVSGGAG